jgi:hypothetical protein
MRSWPTNTRDLKVLSHEVFLLRCWDRQQTHRWNTDTDRGENNTNGRILVPLTDLWRLRLVAHEKAGHGDDSRFSQLRCVLLGVSQRLPCLFRFAYLTGDFFFGENLFFSRPIPVNRSNPNNGSSCHTGDTSDGQTRKKLKDLSVP